MRWCVSVGAVLVAGAIVGGDVAGIAALWAEKLGTRATAAQITQRMGSHTLFPPGLMFDDTGLGMPIATPNIYVG